jgi:hypothetical protein
MMTQVRRQRLNEVIDVLTWLSQQTSGWQALTPEELAERYLQEREQEARKATAYLDGRDERNISWATGAPWRY